MKKHLKNTDSSKLTANCEKPGHSSKQKWLCLLPLLLIFFMTFTVYYPVIHDGGFTWDDDYYVTKNLTLRTLDGLRRIWLEIGAVPQYYPLVHSSFWVEYHLWQLHPLGYHMTNVLLHALNAILLWLLLRRLCIPGAWLAAAVFAIHPVHVESVAWITERKNVLSGFFYLSAILAYMRFSGLDVSSAGTFASSTAQSPTSATSDIKRNFWGFYTLALGLFLCALLSKTVTCTMPAVILLLLWWKRDRLDWHNVLPLIPFFLLGAALALTTVWMEKYHVGALGEEWTLSFVERCLIAGRALWFYAGKLFWPYKLTFIYSRWHIDAAIWWQYIFPLTAVAVFITLWLFRKKIGKAPLVAVLFFAGTLAPALGFFDIYPMRYSFVADHFQYLASIGLIVLCVATVTSIFLRLGSLYRTIGFAAYGMIIIIFGMLVWQQGHIYKNVEILWRDTISKSPGSWMAYNNLGLILVKQGKLDQGIKCYKQALKIKPDFPAARHNLGNAHRKKYKQDLAGSPNNPDVHNNLGVACINTGSLDEAISEFRKALTINPDFVEAQFNLGIAYKKKGMPDRAIAAFNKVLTTNPNHAEAHFNRGTAYAKKGMLDEAISDFTKTLAVNPNHAGVHNNLSVAYYQQGNYKLAVEHYDRAVRLGGKSNPKLLELLRPYR